MAIKRNTRYRLAGSGSNRTDRPKRKNSNQSEWDYKKIAIFGGGLLIVLICIIIGIRAVIAGVGKGAKKESEAASSTEKILKEQVFVDSIPISGMSKAQARAAILRTYTWNMKVRLKIYRS